MGFRGREMSMVWHLSKRESVMTDWKGLADTPTKYQGMLVLQTSYPKQIIISDFNCHI
jgi:hypothetical protein